MKWLITGYLLCVLPGRGVSQFSVEPHPELLKQARVQCVTTFENEPNAAPKKMRAQCFEPSGALVYDSVYKPNRGGNLLRADTLKDENNRNQLIRHYKRDTLVFTEKFEYNGKDTCYSKHFIITGKQSRLIDSVVHHSDGRTEFKHLIDSGIWQFFSYHPLSKQLLTTRWENNLHQTIRTDSFWYDSLHRLIEIRTTDSRKQNQQLYKRAYTPKGLLYREWTYNNSLLTESTQYTYNQQSQLSQQIIVKADQTMIRYRYEYLSNGLPEVCLKEIRSPKIQGGFKLIHRKMFRYSYF